jgi:PAS domain S-box-containing protein
VSDDFLNEGARELYEISPCGYFSTGLDGIFVLANQTFLDWTGYSLDDLIQRKSFQQLLTVPGRIFYETQYFTLLQMQGEVKEIAFDVVRKDGTVLPVLLNARQKIAHENALIHCALFDATDRRTYESQLLRARKELAEAVQNRTNELAREVAEHKAAQEHLHQLTSRLLNLRDDERRDLARNLHDSVGQLLAALSMNLSTVGTESQKLSPRAAEAVAENAELVSQISSEIRTISHLLHPPLLDEVGLPSALRWYVDGLAERAKIKITLELPSDLGRLSQPMELAIFRIVQECLTNIHRHSGSATARVTVLLQSASVCLEVADQGKGMPVDALAGVGLRGMRERLKQFGGELNVATGVGGTTVTATLPIKVALP